MKKIKEDENGLLSEMFETLFFLSVICNFKHDT